MRELFAEGVYLQGLARGVGFINIGVLLFCAEPSKGVPHVAFQNDEK